MCAECGLLRNQRDADEENCKILHGFSAQVWLVLHELYTRFAQT